VSVAFDDLAPSDAIPAGAGFEPLHSSPYHPLPVARYRFLFRLHDDLALPDFAGSLLRGQFGRALRNLACMTGARACPDCQLYRTCPYPAIFETPPPPAHALQRFNQVPNPYVIEPPPLGRRWIAAGDVLAFHIILFGRALANLPLIAYAMQRAFERGIGPQRARGDVEDIVLERPGGPESVWDPESSRLLPHDQTLTVPRFADIGTVTLNIATPLRLQNQGHPVPPDELRPRTLVTALLRRASLLFELHAGLPPVGADAARLAAVAERLTDRRSLQWKDWTRFSSRQEREMTLGGVIGEWRLEGELDELMPWLWLGQWLHAGKNATMGMGMYTLFAGSGADVALEVAALGGYQERVEA
jgi:CRISPR-associated endoribonuclease Cas6